jgi:hypothetical protein
MKPKLLILAFVLCSLGLTALANDEFNEYRVLATNRTSTMEKEMNEMSSDGFRFDATMGGESAFGGKEVIVVMSRSKTGSSGPRYSYKLLATNKTSTMQKELQAAGDLGFQYKGQTVFESAFGGKEVVVILERDREASRRFEYRLLATNKTSTMQKELQQAADAGFVFVGVTIAETAYGGKEVVSILRR